MLEGVAYMRCLLPDCLRDPPPLVVRVLDGVGVGSSIPLPGLQGDADLQETPQKSLLRRQSQLKSHHLLSAIHVYLLTLAIHSLFPALKAFFRCKTGKQLLLNRVLSFS